MLTESLLSCNTSLIGRPLIAINSPTAQKNNSGNIWFSLHRQTPNREAHQSCIAELEKKKKNELLSRKKFHSLFLNNVGIGMSLENSWQHLQSPLLSPFFFGFPPFDAAFLHFPRFFQHCRSLRVFTRSVIVKVEAGALASQQLARLSAYKTVKLPDNATLHPNTGAPRRRACTNTYMRALVYLHAWQEEEMAFLHLESHKQEVPPAHFR